MLPVMVKAALPAVPGVNLLPGVRKAGGELPDLSLTRHDIPVDPRHVASYASICGFPRKDTVPLPYPHLLAFGLHMRIMTDGSFPFPAIGTVHLENSITQHRPISLAEALQVTARPDHLRAHPKGQVFDLLTTVHSRGELVWEETSTFLRRGRGSEDAPGGSTFPEAPAHGITWKLPADLGRRAFGFPRQIAHGMWSMARCVGALENRLPDAVTVAVALKKPILLPGSVAFGSRAVEEGYAFSLTGPRSGLPHLSGAATAAG
jgi:hypothetical protein